MYIFTEGCRDVGGQNHNGSTNHKPFDIRSESNDVIRYDYSYYRTGDVDEQLCHCFTKKVHVSAIHPVKMLPQENRNFQSKSLVNEI